MLKLMPFGKLLKFQTTKFWAIIWMENFRYSISYQMLFQTVDYRGTNVLSLRCVSFKELWATIHKHNKFPLNKDKYIYS